MPELYEDTYTADRHFSFGKNWQSYLQSLTPARKRLARQSLREFLGAHHQLKGKTFIDIGSGSGIFSWAAHDLGAARVVSLDVDGASLASTKSLHVRAGNPAHWSIHQISALNRQALRKLGVFDVVYSWGVLHHTGAMEQGIRNAASLVAPGGCLYLAIYNESRSWSHGSSQFWLWVKRQYNRANWLIKFCIERLYATYLWIGLLASGKNPVRYIASYQSVRGMSWWHDVLDWLGGYPYEFASVERMLNLLGEQGFGCFRIKVRETIGCTEYLFSRVER